MSQTSRLVHCLREKHPFGIRTNFRQSGDDRLLAILFRTAHAPDVPVRVQPIAFRVDEINSIVFNLCTKTFRKNIESSRGPALQQSWPRAAGIPSRRVTCGERLSRRFFNNIQHFFLRRLVVLLWHGLFFLGMLSHVDASIRA
jgi:hypothetical protein